MGNRQTGVFKKSRALLHGHASTLGLKKRSGRWEAEFTMNESAACTAGEMFANSLDAGIKNQLRSSAVRILTHRIGETHNLKDPALQRCFQAAALAKKYSTVHYRLAQVYSAMMKRLLTEIECADVFRIVGGLGIEGSTGLGPWTAGTDGGSGAGAPQGQAHVAGAGDPGREVAGEDEPAGEGSGHGEISELSDGSSLEDGSESLCGDECCDDEADAGAAGPEEGEDPCL